MLSNFCLALFILGPLSVHGFDADFIIAGGGTAGCVLAGRLSEKFSVILISDGDDPGNSTAIPAITFKELPKLAKKYITVKQTDSNLGSDGIIEYLIAKTLGGGTAVNGMVFNRGSPHDYDNWANLTGDQSWSYKNLMPLFKQIEDYGGQFPSDEHHGKGGPIPIQVVTYAPGLKWWLEGGKELGYPVVDPNGPEIPSFCPFEYSRNKGRRVTAYMGYVKPHLDRPTLKVIKNAEVKKVTTTNEGGELRATGVIYKDEAGKLITLTAGKEVIVSAGCMDSPYILMKSGIGPKEVLEEAKVTPIKILPVGENLVDHVFIKVFFQVDKDKTEVYDPVRDLTPENMKLYLEKGDGPYASSCGGGGQAYVVSEVRKREPAPQPEWGDVQYIHIQSPSPVALFPGLIDDADPDSLNIFTMVALVRPKSQGWVRLNPKDIEAQPLIDFKFYSNKDDMDAMLDGIKILMRLYEETEPFKKQGARYSKVPYPACKHLEFRSDDYWKCWLRYISGSGIHAGGTCRMGKADDPRTVVDSNLKVLGVKGLRVIDLSIMPEVTNTNTQAPAYIIGEKGADLILREYGAKS